jgi:pimeloyl-ACP methyl ester carboxylesterase
MSRPEPFVREAGTEPGVGPSVVCLHSNASGSSQWRELMEQLAPSYRVFAPDSYGSGKSPEWPSDREITLGDEVALIEPVLARAGRPLVLVGHSFGAAVALIAALADPSRVAALALYEPTLFSLIDADGPPPNEADGIRGAVAAATAALDAGDRERAAGHFIDYWMGAGSWAGMPDARRAPIAASGINVRRWAHALHTESTPLSAFSALEMPVLLMSGRRTTVSARGVLDRLQRVLPRMQRLEFDGIGHMGPITHAQRVNDAIVDFLRRVAPGR